MAELGDIIRQARQAKRWTQLELAERASTEEAPVKQQDVTRIERPGARLGSKYSKYIVPILKALGLPLSLAAGLDTAAVFDPAQLLETGTPVFGQRDLKIYAAVEGGPGEVVVSNDHIDIVTRPWFLQYAKDAYGVMIVGTSMEPRFNPGEIVFVNPHLPVLRGQPAIFSGDTAGTFKATIKIFERETPTEWTVAQYNPAKSFKLPKKAWTKAQRVVGAYMGA